MADDDVALPPPRWGQRRSNFVPRRRFASRKWSGPGPDKRDPQPLGRLLGQTMRRNGWQTNLAHAGVFARWAQIVGSDIADHCRPESLKDGELVVVAESTAWATQLRLFHKQIYAKLTAELGRGVVTRLRIQGPTQPGRVNGPRRVRFNISRDTF
ncbi:DUF721 domain-containing protein [Natronoglycomyces albus]|uniref:DUF721 domain-containing protein n=2 Tax=Natronoglycomyces albus TaxID=2811108 RepID=A0A895XU69_9ACTN|nr:DUF721 domain-containing protein [Natronoglycomyces albus]